MELADKGPSLDPRSRLPRRRMVPPALRPRRTRTRNRLPMLFRPPLPLHQSRRRWCPKESLTALSRSRA
eukprot:2213391-Lingulodinium_polyedra.AAC.1